MIDNNADGDRFTIELSKGRFQACVSLEDAPYVQQYTWSAVKTKYRTYAVRSEKGNNKKKLHLAREIMVQILGRDLLAGESVRHKNKDSLDNTRENLELKRSLKFQEIS